MPDATTEFLAQNGWGDAVRTPIAGDLSARRYDRLSRAGDTAILMQVDPTTDTSLPNFIRTTDWLRATGFSAPELYAVSVTNGLALLEDFGDAKLSGLVTTSPKSQPAHYQTVLDTLLRLAETPAPDVPKPSASDLADATTITADWYPNADASALSKARSQLTAKLSDLLKEPAALSLRDFHADNIIWLPSREGIQKVGLLDYQDAFLTHPAYDLMSLLTDARVDVPKSLQTNLIATFAGGTGTTAEETAFAVALLGAQRNLRILGIFARAARRDGKPHHVQAIPRVWKHLTDCLAHSALADLRQTLLPALPPPTPDLLQRLAA